MNLSVALTQGFHNAVLCHRVPIISLDDDSWWVAIRYVTRRAETTQTKRNNVTYFVNWFHRTASRSFLPKPARRRSILSWTNYFGGVNIFGKRRNETSETNERKQCFVCVLLVFPVGVNHAVFSVQSLTLIHSDLEPQCASGILRRRRNAFIMYW